MEVKILNFKESNLNPFRISDKGAHAVIYSGLFQNKKIAIKRIAVRSKKARSRAIKEWFILRVASAAGIGPYLEPYLGFDILMFNDCI